MKRIYTLLLFILFVIPSYTQLVRGRVFDGETKKVVPYANVFFNSTTIGVITDQYGNFTLKSSGNEKLPIAITALGYNSILLTGYSEDIPLEIYLIPKIYKLGEVIVKSKRTAKERSIREENLRLFRKQFLGETTNALRSRILNEDDIVFHTVSESESLTEAGESNKSKIFKENDISTSDNNEPGTLLAYSLKPIIIINDGLGYQITYYLDTFEYSPANSSVKIFGNLIFKDIAREGSARQKAENRRRVTYLGSTMHFFRELWSDNLDSSGYVLKSLERKVLTSDSITGIKYSNGSYINYKKGVKIFYHSKTDWTYFTLISDSAFFDKSGYFDPISINWNGVMAKQRIADQLPYDYIYKTKPEK